MQGVTGWADLRERSQRENRYPNDQRDDRHSLRRWELEVRQGRESRFLLFRRVAMRAVEHHRRLLGEAVRTRRKNAEYSQEVLAEKAGLSTVFISRVERGKESPSLDSLVKIARALELRVCELVDGF